MAKRQYNRTYYYSIGGMLTDEEVHQIWEIVGNALDRNGFVDADGEPVSYTHLTLPTILLV